MKLNEIWQREKETQTKECDLQFLHIKNNYGNYAGKQDNKMDICGNYFNLHNNKNTFDKWINSNSGNGTTKMP